VHPRVQTLLLTRLSALLQAGTTSEWMCGENIEQQMQQERRAILELPFVSGISDAAHGKRGGFRVNLRCHTAKEECGGLKQGVPVLVSSTRTTLLECLQEVHNQVLRQHGLQCVAASKALQAERMAQANSPAASKDALRTHNDVSLTGPAMSHEGDCGAQQYQASPQGGAGAREGC